MELSAGGQAEIFYTVNGMSPFGEEAIRYDGPILIDQNALLTFVAKDGDLWSEQGTELYELKEDLQAPDLVARALTVDDDNLVYQVSRGEEGPMSKAVTIRSVGLQPVEIQNIYITMNPNSWSFWEEGIFKLETPFTPGYLNPGESIELVVSYTPTETLRTGLLVIQSNEQRTNDGYVTIGLTGRIWDW